MKLAFLLIICLLFSLSVAQLELQTDNEQNENDFLLTMSFNPLKYFQSSIKQKQQCERVKELQNSFSGYLKVDDTSNSVLAYTFYLPQSMTQDQGIEDYPLILWLQGGPGSSSQIGNFLMIGPQILDSKGNIMDNKFAWNKNHSILFIDQPIGTGLSYAENINQIPKDQNKVAQHFTYALNQFFNSRAGCVQKFNLQKIQTRQKTYIFGESYAGKYIPAISQKILRDQSINSFINLKGIGIGDGFTNPLEIMRGYGKWAQQQGLINFNQRIQIDNIYKKAKIAYLKQDYKSVNYGFNQILQILRRYGNVQDIYNIAQKHSFSTETFENYMQSYEFLEMYNFNQDITFGQQKSEVYSSFLEKDFFLDDCFERLADVLSIGLDVLIYQGENDAIVCQDCTENWLKKLKYDRIKEFNAVKMYNDVIIDGKVMSLQKKLGNLQYKVIKNAGHMVPMDQPEVALQMLNQFIKQIEDQKK